jgi:hypothetical protein
LFPLRAFTHASPLAGTLSLHTHIVPCPTSYASFQFHFFQEACPEIITSSQPMILSLSFYSFKYLLTFPMIHNESCLLIFTHPHSSLPHWLWEFLYNFLWSMGHQQKMIHTETQWELALWWVSWNPKTTLEQKTMWTKDPVIPAL